MKMHGWLWWREGDEFTWTITQTINQLEMGQGDGERGNADDHSPIHIHTQNKDASVPQPQFCPAFDQVFGG